MTRPPLAAALPFVRALTVAPFCLGPATPDLGVVGGYCPGKGTASSGSQKHPRREKRAAEVPPIDLRI